MWKGRYIQESNKETFIKQAQTASLPLCCGLVFYLCSYWPHTSVILWALVFSFTVHVGKLTQCTLTAQSMGSGDMFAQ